MRVLAIDTSYPEGSAALHSDGRCSSMRLGAASSHLVALGHAVSSLLGAAGVAVRDVDRVAIITGPGSFTGLRVGMAFVKGLYAASPLDVVVMSSLELLARQAAGEGLPVSPMIDARRDEVYAACYHPPVSSRSAEAADAAPRVSSGTPGGESRLTALVEIVAPCVAAPDQYIESLRRWSVVFIGSGAVRYRPQIEKVFGVDVRFASEHEPDTRFLCRLAKDLAPLRPEEVVTLEPSYIRPSDVELKPLKDVRAYDRS